jgi:hypothetical protein
MTRIQRNILVLPLVLVLRMVPLAIVVVLEKIVKLGYAYQDFLNENGIHWKTGR